MSVYTFTISGETIDIQANNYRDAVAKASAFFGTNDYEKFGPGHWIEHETKPDHYTWSYD